MTTYVSPMRPMLDLQLRDLPASGWAYQPKLDEERGVLWERGLWNRLGKPVASHKSQAFVAAIAKARELFGNRTLDVGMIGFRNGALGSGALVIYDIPDDLGLQWAKRYSGLLELPSFDPTREPAKAGEVYRLPYTLFGRILMSAVKGVPGVEGIIGRDMRSGYIAGDSRAMLKCKWSNQVINLPEVSPAA